MDRLSDIFYRKANWISCLLATAIMVAYASIILGGQSSCFEDQLPEGYKVLGLKAGYSLNYAMALFGSMNETGLFCYRNLILIWDNIFPVLYGVMYILWLSFIYKNTRVRHSKYRFLNFYPLVPVLLDWTENFFEWRLTESFIRSETFTESQVQIASVASQVKWIASSLNYLIIVIGIVLLIFNLIKQRSSKNDRSKI